MNTLSTINGVAPVLGEWYHDGTTFYMYFGAVDPTTKVVKVGTLVNGITSNQSYVTIDHINFLGFNGTIMNIDQSNHMLFTNCEAGFAGIHAEYPGSYNTFDYCYFHDTNANGLYGGIGWTVTNSTIEKIAVYEAGWYGYDAQGKGLTSTNGGFTLQYSIIRNVAADGTFLSGDNVTIDKNLFDNCVTRTSDQAAIYMNNNGGSSSNRVVTNNIIINCMGSVESDINGGFNPPPLWNQGHNYFNTVEGIYMDEPCSGVIITGNTVAGCLNGSGIKMHRAHDITISNNTFFNNQAANEFEHWGVDADYLRDIVYTGNKIIPLASYQIAWAWATNNNSANNDMVNLAFTTLANNNYERPVR